MTETTTAPTNSELEASEAAAMMASFNDAQAAAKTGAEPEPAKAEPSKAEPAKAAEPAKVEAADEFPAELLGGKAEPRPDPEAEAKADMELIKQRPTGQIKHDHFETVQKAAQRRVEAKDAELAKFRADLEKLRTTTGKPPDDYELTKKQLSEMREELGRVAFERTPEFREKFTDRETRLRGLAEKAAKDNGIDPKVIANALASTGAQRFEILANAGELSPGALSYISNVLAQHDELQEEKGTVLSQSKERYAQWEQTQKAQQAQEAQQRKAIEEQEFTQAHQELAGKFRLFKETTDEKFARIQSETIARAKHKLENGGLGGLETAKMVLKAEMYDTHDRYLTHVVDKLNAANAKISELTASGPHVNGTAQLRTSGDDANLTEEQRMERSYAEARRAHGL